MQATDYATQADARRDARIALWGDVGISKRECLPMQGNGVWTHAVTATVNGRTVVFFFDCFGRADEAHPTFVLR